MLEEFHQILIAIRLGNELGFLDDYAPVQEISGNFAEFNGR